MATPLEELNLERPCATPWSELQGDERTRRCPRCGQNVYDLTGLSEAEATTLIARHEGLVSMRVFRRSDGTVITRDCQQGFTDRAWATFATLQRLAVVGLLAAVFLALGAGVLVTVLGDEVRGYFGMGTNHVVHGHSAAASGRGCRHFYGVNEPGY
jgi:hypothetical protein